eukprot:COSAG01_NODE_8164_length_2894_cov_63.589624_3_plen_143_part_00
MHVVDDECRSAWSLGEIVQVRKAFQFDHIEQSVLTAGHTIETTAGPHEIDVFELFPLGASENRIEQCRCLTGTNPAYKSGSTWVGQTQSMAICRRIGMVLFLGIVNFDATSSFLTTGRFHGSTGTRYHEPKLILDRVPFFFW